MSEFLDYCQMAEIDPPSSPELYLVSAVLARAALDATQKNIKPQFRISARRWFLSSSMEPYSFNWALIHLSRFSISKTQILKRVFEECR